MLKELIELRQIKNERESILRTNQYYIAQVSQMEIKISEFKANLQAKDSEISYLNQKVSGLETKLATGPISSKHLEDQILLLQAENEHLKMQLKEAGDISQIKIQLEYALKMKEIFEEKYREAKIQLLTIRPGTEGSSEMDLSKSNKLRLMNEIDQGKKKFNEMQNQVLILSAENEELLSKIEGTVKDEPKEKINFPVQAVKSTPKYITSPEPSRYLVTSSSSNYSEASKIITRSIDLSSKSATQLPRIVHQSTSKIIRLNVPAAQKLPKNEVAQYCPSFMRNRKTDNKPTPSPSTIKQSQSSFPEDYPEEDEF